MSLWGGVEGQGSLQRLLVLFGRHTRDHRCHPSPCPVTCSPGCVHFSNLRGPQLLSISHVLLRMSEKPHEVRVGYDGRTRMSRLPGAQTC